MISYFKKSVNDAYKVSKKAVIKATSSYMNNNTENQSHAQIVLNELIKSKKQILSTKKMGQLATSSYQMQQFDLIIERIFSDLILNEDLKFFYRDPSVKNKTLRYRRNLLVVCGYLVKHGASGFIDQFRQQIMVFQHYTNQQVLPMNEKYSFQIKSRAEYVVMLLKDKSKLLREKQLAMLIKKKMKMYEHISVSNQNQSMTGNMEHEQKSKSKKQKVQNFLQNYIFKYAYKLDEKLDQVADVIITQVEKYLLEEMPENFEIQQLQEINENRQKTQFDFSEQTKKNQQKFITQKTKQKVVTKNLLDL